MKNLNDGAPSKDPIREFFGPPPPRRPIPSNSFNTLVKIYSFFPDQNPFSEYASYAKTPAYGPRWSHGNLSLDNLRRLRSDDVHDDTAIPRGEKEASDELVGPPRVEVQNLMVHNEANNNGTASDLCKDDSFSSLEVIMDELGRSDKTKIMDNMASDEKGITAEIAEADKVLEDLSGIERILMDESENLGLLQLPDKGVKFDLFDDFSSMLDIDVHGNNSVTVENNESRKPTVEKNLNVAGEKKRKDSEFNRSTSVGDIAKSQAHLSVDREISDSREVVNQQIGTCPEDARVKERKLCNEKVPQHLLELGGFAVTAQRSKNRGTVSISKCFDGVGKENKSGVVSKDKTNNAKRASLKDVKSGKCKHMSVAGEASNSTISEGADPVVHGKMVKQNVHGSTGKLSAKKVTKDRRKRHETSIYTREQLLHLRKTAYISGDMLKAVREIGAKLHDEYQNSAARETIDASGSNKTQIVPSTDNKKVEEKGCSVSKNKKRGSSSETKKEKKKRQKRKKRAEMNKKLGVKRLKLKPILKPKVVPHCRHYLKGRCQEGEKCKFSHDVIPLTKSKPCCHFARQACMKGDDCPFDHQLSKYPCNNYVATGFCSRGDSCLFSHKISAKADSETTAGGLNCEPNSLDQLDKLNSKQPLNANASSPGITTPKSPEENLAMQIAKPMKAPKGLSFLSSGKSSLMDSAKHEEADVSQQRGDYAGTSARPNVVAGAAANSGKTLTNIPSSATPRGIGFLSFGKTSVDSSQDKKQASPPSHRDSSSFLISGKSLLIESATHERVGSSNFPSPGGPSYDNSGGKLQATTPTREKGSVNESDKLKSIQQRVWGSPTSSGTCSNKVDLAVKSASNTAQKALLSTLKFAAKYESGIKMGSVASSKEVNDNEGTTGDNGCRQKQPMKASAILDFLYSGSNKEQQ